MSETGDNQVTHFRKKPVVIEARQWTDGNGFMIVGWIRGSGGKAELHRSEEPSCITIVTLEGTMRADHDDWIIKGIKGEFYPCKPDIFAETYEAVNHERVYDPEPRITTFTLGRDSFGSPRHAAACAWLTENGFDVNVVPMGALVTISGDRLTVDVFDDNSSRRLTQQTVTLVSEPSALVRGETGHAE